MNREVFKSILLAVLVVASIAMTWNIWFYKTDFKNYKEPSNSTNSVAIADSLPLADVVCPTLALRKTDDKTVGQTEVAKVSDVYRIFRKARYSSIVLRGRQRQVEKKANTVSYEIIFPAPLTAETLTKLFSFTNNRQEIPQSTRIDRIEIYRPSQGSELTATFSMQTETDAFSAKVSGIDLNDLAHDFSGNLVEYGTQKLKGRVVYLPQSSVRVRDEMTYSAKTDIESFIPILFTDPKNVVHYRGRTAFNDGERQLEETSNILQYANPNPGISNSSAAPDPILHSYEFINSFKAWTNRFIFDGLNTSSGQSTVIFRLYLNGYRVYNTDFYPNPYLTMMELTWSRQELNAFNRTLLTFNRIDEPQSTTLDSGPDILKSLAAASVPIREIEDLSIGYRIDKPQSQQDYSLKASPDWFYKIGGRWYSVANALAEHHSGGQKESER
ncbi:MAG: two-component system activity regulator YycH [Sporolactobacillus sp.]|jgi:regulatory protein YycH of two-component signal transduction system YycFG|nr:two-component system activity regulator YycH [Sporolactobacillus sp.]